MSAKKKSTNRKKRRPGDRDASVLVVGVGASAGGLSAYREFLSALREDSGMAFVLIQHLDPNHESMMAPLLAKVTPLRVEEIVQGSSIKPNTVYVIPPNKYVTISGNRLLLEEAVKRNGMRMAIDHFFTSLAQERADRAVGVVLSGTGSDGTLGVKEIKSAGGLTIAQEPAEAEYDGMPRSAAATNCVDFVLTIRKMPQVLENYGSHAAVVDDPKRPTCFFQDEPEPFGEILRLLESRTEYDFRCYKPGTLNRRIHRRMSLQQVHTLDAYRDLLRKEPGEVHALFKDLLISVTSFFREPEAWDVLEREVVGPIVEGKNEGEPARAWITGCATGEEAYSACILFHEQMEKQQKQLDLSIFATDIDENAIGLARAGAYGGNLDSTVAPERLQKYFRETNDQFQVVKRVRESTIFAVQNLIGDPPFSKLDLVTCRNVMIYLEASVQKKLLELFHFALRDGGYLFLGNSETVGQRSDLFEPVDKQWRIYRKIGVAKRTPLHYPNQLIARRNQRQPEKRRGFKSAQGRTVSELARETLLERYAPPAVIVDSRHVVQHFHGPVRNFLDFPSGEPTRDLFTMALPGMRSKLRTVVHQAHITGEVQMAHARRVQRHDEVIGVRMTAEPVAVGDPEYEGFLMVTFHQEKTTEEKLDGVDEKTLEFHQVEYELQITRQDLQRTIENLETSNEQLKASNEEVISMNEELQSSNEELETSREDLKSLNEELSTVNSQLEEKVGELEQTNDDVTNLLNSTEIATLFLDNNFHIRRFTPALSKLLRIIPSDVGRPVIDLATSVRDPDLLEDARKVLRQLSPLDRQLLSETGQVFIRSVLPYRTADDRIDGVVITYSDVTRLQRISDQLRARERQQAAIAKIGKQALEGGPLQPLFDLAVRLLADTLRCEMAKVLEYLPQDRQFALRSGVGWDDGLVGNARIGAGLDSQAGFTMQYAGPVVVENLTEEKRFNGPPLLHDHGVVSGMSVLIAGVDDAWGVLGVHTRQQRGFNGDDVNFLQSIANFLTSAIASRRSDQQLRESENQMRLLTDSLPAMIAYLDQEQRYRFVNARYSHYYNQSKDSILGRTVRDLAGAERYAKAEPHIRGALNGKATAYEINFTDPDGKEKVWHVSYVPDISAGSTIPGFYAIVLDVSELRQTEERVRLLLEHTTSGFIRLDSEFRCRYHNEAALTLLACGRENLQGCALWDACPGLDGQALQRALRICQEEQRPTSVEECLVWEDRCFDFRFSPLTGGIVVTFADVTARSHAQQALKMSEERFRLAERAFQGLVYEWRLADDFAWRSRGMKDVVGIAPEDAEPTTHWWFERIDRKDIDRVKTAIQEALEDSACLRYDVKYRVRHADGSWVSVWDRGFILRDANGRAMAVYGSSVDVTAHVELERKLNALNDHLEERVRARTAELTESAENLERRSQELAMLAENVPAVFAYLSRDRVFRFVNKQFQELYCASQEELIGQPITAVFSVSDLEPLEAIIRETLNGKTMTYERHLDIPRDGRRWVSAIHVPRRSRNGGVEGFYFLAQDISKRKKLEAELVDIAEDERATFSRELHDGLGSFLSGLSFRFRALEKDIKEGILPKQEEVARMAGLITEGMAQARELAKGLQPVEDKPDGLMLALASLQDSIDGSVDVTCHYECPEPVLVADAFIANHLYRIAQEATHNALKHSGGNRIDIRLSRRATRQSTALTLIVEDNGIGIPIGANGGLGLRTMAYRANSIGAELATTAGKHGGTLVTCTLSLPREAG